MKFKNIFLLMFNVCFVSLLQSMDNPVLAEKKVVVWDVILSHDKSLFSHDMIRSLAVNREFEKRLRSTAQDRRQYCVSLVPDIIYEHNIIYKHILEKSGRWHKYGSACGIVGRRDDSTADGKYWLQLDRLDLVDGVKTRYKTYTAIDFGGFLSESYSLSLGLSNYRKGFFDARDNFCCYGYSNKDLNGRVCENTIILYKLSPQGELSREIIICGTNMNKKGVVANEQLDSRKVLSTLFDNIVEFFKSI